MTAAAGSRSSAASSLRGVRVPHGSSAAVPGGRPPGGAAVIRIRLLGQFGVERDGQEIALASFGGRLARRLLRLLALRRGTLVVKELIADALWPDNPPADPAANIEVLVSRIRRAMGDRAVVRTGPGGYVLADGDRCWVDAEAFLSAVHAGQAALAARPADRLASFRAALGIWRGEPLPEDTYADWAQADRRRLWLAYLEALDGAAMAALESPAAVAAAGEATAWAGQAVAAEPLRESSVLLLVRALAATGDQAGALAAFDRYRDRLAAETGLDPTPQALEIRQRALEGQPARGMPGDQIAGLTPGPLPAGLISGLFRDQLLAEAIIRQAGRTPFTVTEVIAALARQGVITRDGTGKWRLRHGRDAVGAAQIVAAGIGQAAGNRLAGLPSRWRDMLGLIVLLGRPAPPALLAAASGSGQRTVLDTLEGLGSAGLACPGPRGWWIGHDPLRQAVTAAFNPAETARLHSLLAEALRQCGADSAETAGHLAASGDHDHAAMAYAAAARGQLERVCDREAIRLANAGLTLDPAGRARGALLETRGEARRRAGQLTEARADLTAALDSLDEPASRSRILAQLAILDARTADAARGSELAALAIAEAGNQPAALGQALAAAAIIDLAEGNLARSRYRVRRAARLLDQAGDRRGSARLLYWRAMECFTGGRLHDAADQLDRLAHLAVTPGEILRLWSPRATRGHALVFLGRAADGLAEIGETLAWARIARHPAVEAECLWHRAEALASLGQASEAIEAARQAAGIAARIGHAEWTAAAYRGLGIACEAAGLTARADSAYRSSLRAAEGIPLFRAWAAARLGALLARQGQPGEAAPYIQAALAGGTPLTRHEARWAQAELLASQGDNQACAATAAAALDRALHDGYLVLVPRLRELAGR